MKNYTYIHTCIHTYMHACIHACIHTYTHTYKGVYRGRQVPDSSLDVLVQRRGRVICWSVRGALLDRGGLKHFLLRYECADRKPLCRIPILCCMCVCMYVCMYYICVCMYVGMYVGMYV